jgi:hypothetical protein
MFDDLFITKNKVIRVKYDRSFINEMKEFHNIDVIKEIRTVIDNLWGKEYEMEIDAFNDGGINIV